MTSTAAPSEPTPTDPATELPTEVVADADLYRASGMIDVLRDSAKELIGSPVSEDTLRRMLDRYTRLRAAAAGTLTAPASRRLLDWTDELAEPVTAVDEIFDAAATLARGIDLVIGLPGYVLARRSADAEMRALFAQLPVTGHVPEDARGSDRGQYL